jgi:large subunit ribosomal protein L30
MITMATKAKEPATKVAKESPKEAKKEKVPAKAAAAPAATTNPVVSGNEIAVVRVRGVKGTTQEISTTLKMFGVERPNYCVILPPTLSLVGMIRSVKSYVTWGNIDEETKKLLISKRGPNASSKGKSNRQVFRLNPPKKGFGRKGIKLDYTIGGALGDRGDKINDLIRRMI